MNSKKNKVKISDNRRDFLKKSALFGLATVFNPLPNMLSSNIKEQDFIYDDVNSDKKTITVLITTDIHSQINTHDEFFWENNQAVYKKRGGMAVLKTMIDWGRYAEIFAYDVKTGILSLENPGIAESEKD